MNWKERLRRARKKAKNSTDSEVLKKYSESNYVSLRREVARNKHTPKEVLSKLANDSNV